MNFTKHLGEDTDYYQHRVYTMLPLDTIPSLVSNHCLDKDRVVRHLVLLEGVEG
jgi:hypothetical protein